MKRIVSIIIAVFILVSCFAFSVSAANDGIVKAGRVTAKAGDTITIPVSYEDQPGIYILSVTISYDTRAVEFIELEQSDSQRFNYTVNSEKEGSVKVVMDGQKIGNVTGDLKLFNLKFKVKADAEAGRALFPVYCNSGDATALKREGKKYQTVSLIPSTSTGSVTILCAEHSFDLEMGGDKLQCSRCGAVKEGNGEVSVDSNAGLPEVDISSDTGSPIPDGSSASEHPGDDSSAGNDGENNSDDEFKIWYLFPIFAAVIIIGGCVFFVVKKRRHTDE